MRGAVLYVGLNPWEELAATPIALPVALQPIRTDGYALNVGSKELIFVPYFDVQMESYNTYFRKA